MTVRDKINTSIFSALFYVFRALYFGENKIFGQGNLSSRLDVNPVANWAVIEPRLH